MSYFHAALDGFYQLGETIGSGGFAKVKAAYHILTGEKVAIKIMTKAELGEDLPRVKKEIEALKSIEHLHICQLYQVIETSERYYIVMEYCPGGELFDYIVEKDRLAEPEARALFRQILSAVGYLHSRGFAHRDLKPENILIDEEQDMKLIDFGLSARPQGGACGLLTTCCGSPAYAAPELIGQQQYKGSAADVWSLGVLLYALLCGYLPFEDQNLAALYKKIQKGKFELPDWLSPQAADLLSLMMCTDPAVRIAVPGMACHAWVTDCGQLPRVEFDGGCGGVLGNSGCCQGDDAGGILADADSSAISPARSPVSDRCLTELALHCKRPKREVAAALRQRKFDYLTATHLIMCRRLRRGSSIQLMSEHWLAQMQQHPRQSAPHQQLRPGASIGWGRLFMLPPPPVVAPVPPPPGLHQFASGNDCAWLEEKPIPRLRQQAPPQLPPPQLPGGMPTGDFLYGSPMKPASQKQQQQQLPPPPICGVSMLGAATAAAAAAAENKENQLHQPTTFAVPVTPVRVGRARHKVAANQAVQSRQHQQAQLQQQQHQAPDESHLLLNPLSPSRSVDSGLNTNSSQHQHQQHQAMLMPNFQLNQSPTQSPMTAAMMLTAPPPTPNVATPSASTASAAAVARTPRSVFGSLERLGGRFRQAFTPKKRPGPGGSCESGPRKLSAFHNVTTTEECHPQAVLNKLLRALSDRRIQYKQTGYLLRCQVCDDWGKVQLAFDLEVCGLSRQDGGGVRRKRVVGDSWHYKRLCEDILHTAQLQ